MVVHSHKISALSTLRQYVNETICERKPQTITLGDTGRWKTARFPIDDALFSNRCNVRDFRVSVSDEGSLILRSVGVEQLASEQDETNEGCSVSE